MSQGLSGESMSKSAEGNLVVLDGKSGDGAVAPTQPGVEILPPEDGQVTLDEVSANKLRWEITEIIERMAADIFVLASKLHRVKYDGLYMKWGYKTFDEYINSDEIKFARRKALYHVEIWDWFGQLSGEVRDKVKEIGWCKLVHLTRVVNEDNVDEWVVKAREMTVNQLLLEKKRYLEEQRALAEARAAAETGDMGVGAFSAEERAKEEANIPEKVHSKNFKLFDDQLEVVNGAISVAQEISGSDKSGYNLTMICQDFCAHNTDVRPDGESYLHRIEQIFRCKLIAVDLETKQVIYGEDAMKQVLNTPPIPEGS